MKNYKRFSFYFLIFFLFSCENKNEEVFNGLFINGELAQVSINSITDVEANSATINCIVNKKGKGYVSARGVCWSTAQKPTINNDFTTTKDTGNIAIKLNGLKLGTQYYVRAYITNTTGTNYGVENTFTTDNFPSIITINPPTNLTSTSATINYNVTNDGGNPVTARGVCWSTNSNPTIALSTKTNNGNGIGSFSATITNLTIGTVYYVRSYATNSVGTAYGNEINFTTQNLPSLTTNSITNITTTTAMSGGNIIADGGAVVISRGVCWSNLGNPTLIDNKTIDGNGLGTFTSTLVNLQLGTIYYVRAYATNSVGTAYGAQQTFTTNSYAKITTNSISNISSTSAICGGNISVDGGASVSARGVCWSTTTGPTISNNKTTDGTGIGSFSSSITGLSPGTTYYVKAYATNATGTSYGDQMIFTTLAKPTISTNSIYSITTSSATGGGAISSDGGATVVSRGVCWSTNQWPTISDNKTSDGSGTGNFTSYINGLSQGITYYVIAYATNSVGTAYGNQVSFTTATIPTLSTTAASSITTNSATSGGNISSDGGATVTARGVCWSSTTSTPTTSLSTKTTDGSGTGIFNSSIFGLTSGTTYYVRAYAINSAGTAYGSSISFKTTTLSTISTTSISSINSNSAISGGYISSDGGASVTQRGVCWSSSTTSPTIYDNSTSDGNGTGSFISYLTGLTSGVTYYVRAYATNSAGTVYGSSISFTTTALSNLVTSTISSITANSAISGGVIYNDGGASVTQRGVCWSSSTTSPTIYSDSYTTDGSGTGSFTSYLSGLTSGVTYYVRAYAINNVGTSYGSVLNFTTATIPTITTLDVSSVTNTTASCGGSIINDGGAAVTARGVCWSSTTSSPTTSLSTKTIDGASTGNFISSLTGLTINTNYYVRAYATNNYGTAYGTARSFKTTSATIVVGLNHEGGIVAYIFKSGDPGYVSGQVHGIIAAPTDQSSGIQWYNGSNTTTGATGTAIGTGLTNTNKIVASQGAGNYAAKLCYDLVLNGYSDWYLPSKDELTQLYNNRVAIGGFNGVYYRSSSESSSTNAWEINFSNGSITSYAKSDVDYVRAIRYF